MIEADPVRALPRILSVMRLLYRIGTREPPLLANDPAEYYQCVKHGRHRP